MNDQHERITLRIPKAVHHAAKRAASAEHVSLNSYVVRCLSKATRPRQKNPLLSMQTEGHRNDTTNEQHHAPSMQFLTPEPTTTKENS